MSAALSGALLFLAFLPLPTRFLVWVALVPWLSGLEAEPRLAGGTRRAARTGAVLFGVFWALHLAWVLLLVVRLGMGWPASAYAGQVLLLALLGAALGAGLHRLRRVLPLPVAAATAWVAVEWARGHLLGPLRFPWSPLALPLVDWLPLLQPAAWLGEAGPGFLVVAVNGLVAMSVRHRVRGSPPGPPFRVAPLLVAGGLVGAWWMAGEWRLARAAVRDVVRAAAVQPAVPLAVKRDPARALPASRDSLDRLLADLPEAHVAVLPETAVPVLFPDTVPSAPAAPTEDVPSGGAGEIEAWLARWSARAGMPLVVGAYATGTGRENAVLLVGPDGVLARYGKVGLVPGVEWVPWGELSPGGAPRPLPGPGFPGPLVCIESAWDGLALRHVRAGAGWLVNVTNDGWLGESRPWTRTPAFWQHPAHLVLRSVETGRGALRVGNNGLTGLVSPLGHWRTLLEPHRSGVAVAQLERLAGETLFVRLGPILGPSCLLALLAAALPPGLRRRRLRGKREERVGPR